MDLIYAPLLVLIGTLDIRAAPTGRQLSGSF
jgi:hypothetical protein